MMPPKPPPDVEEGVGTADETAGVASVALAVGTTEVTSGAAEDAAGVASVALAEEEGRRALVRPPIIPPKPPDPVDVGAAEETAVVASVAFAVGTTEVASEAGEETAEVTSGAAEDTAGVASVALAEEEGRRALVRPPIIPPKPPDPVDVGAAEETAVVASVAFAVGTTEVASEAGEETAEVTSEAGEEAAEVKSVAAEEAAEVASVALAVGAGRTALVTSETISPKSLVNPGSRPPLSDEEVAAGALEVGVTKPVGAMTTPLEDAATVGLAALEEPAAADEPLLAVETADSASFVDVVDPRPIFNKPLDGRSMRGELPEDPAAEDPAAEDPAALDSVFPDGLGVATTPVIVVEGETNTGVVRVIVWLSLSPEFDPELEASSFDDPRPFDRLAMRSPRLSDESRFVVSDFSEVVLSGVEAAEGALVMVMLVNCRFTCRGK
ncbi:hypothetical protein PG997_007616 [Apiospora hydei]|uniref:Uncharacterized protein n=1 Tax=Apiospora hydei TaxID=1337664 RepID=A0ABR1W8I7_9PEZI